MAGPVPHQTWFEALRTWRAAVRSGQEGLAALACLLLATLVLLFAVIANVMTEGETQSFDQAVLMAMRRSAADPIGPAWFEDSVRDITSLGSNAVLLIVVLAAVGFLRVCRTPGVSLLLVASVGGGIVLVQALKPAFGRVRPDIVSHAVSEVARSFPSGHATLSAVTYLTLGALIARAQTTPARKAYILAIAMTLTLLVGVSRVYLGLHWPTDVLAGWSLGTAWALACSLMAFRFQEARRSA